jgi:hypothetical protein
MPYAQQHYPFENKERFENLFPADFVSEGLDQTRGWFYTLLVLSTHLFGRAPWKNLIVTGLVLAEDGKKMSKSLKNYPDPNEIIDKYGADALRCVYAHSHTQGYLNAAQVVFGKLSHRESRESSLQGARRQGGPGPCVVAMAQLLPVLPGASRVVGTGYWHQVHVQRTSAAFIECHGSMGISTLPVADQACSRRDGW